MECNLEELKKLTESPGIITLENAIAAKMGFSIYKGNYDKLLQLLKNEVEESGLELNKLERFISDHPGRMEEFTQLFLEKEDIKDMGFGFSLSYSIYLVYLIEKTQEELKTYLVRRRFPQAQMVVKQLFSIKKKMCL